jgi:hypothetical protein
MPDVLNLVGFPSLCEIDFSSSAQIRQIIRDRYYYIFGASDDGFIDDYICTVENLFNGQYPEYLAMDTAYHDITHTLQATLCLAELIFHRHQERVSPQITANDFRRSLVAVLLHDIGFLKKVDDKDGTGAKYSHIHELRSCMFARNLLEGRGWPEDDVRVVENLISSTGPRADLTKIKYRGEVEHLLGQIVCTADYIGQMSDPRYPDRLEPLFKEFEESYCYQQLPESQWPFKSFESLLRGTPAFWDHFVKRKLNEECAGVWRHLACPLTGRNPYMDSLASNLAKIREMISGLTGPAADGHSLSSRAIDLSNQRRN